MENTRVQRRPVCWYPPPSFGCYYWRFCRGIASVLPVKAPGEPELLEMSPEQAEQTHIKLQELEELARLRRQQRSRSLSCYCCMISMHDHLVPDYLRSWEM